MSESSDDRMCSEHLSKRPKLCVTITEKENEVNEDVNEHQAVEKSDANIDKNVKEMNEVENDYEDRDEMETDFTKEAWKENSKAGGSLMNKHSEEELEIENVTLPHLQKRDSLTMDMDIVTMIESIIGSFKKSLKRLKRRMTNKVNKRIRDLEKNIVIHTNTPLIVDISKQTAILQIEFPIEELNEFITFDQQVADDRQKLDAFKMIMTVALRRCATVEEAPAAILTGIIRKSIQERFSSQGKGLNKFNFSNTTTYVCMRDVILDYFNETSESQILTELSHWLSEARDREGGRKKRNEEET